MQIRGEVAIISGASSGVGRRIAERLAHAGARLVLLGRDAARLEEACASCRAEGGEANIDGRMDFLGERVEGNVNIDTESPMGQMLLETTIEGERLGDC